MDRDAFDTLVDWYGFCQSLLKSLAEPMTTEENPTKIQLWPEHFDVALREHEGCEGNLRGAPADMYFSEPNLYVGPFHARNGDFGTPGSGGDNVANSSNGPNP